VRHRLFPLTLTISQRVRGKYWHYVIANFCRGRRPCEAHRGTRCWRPESCGRCREQHPCEAHRGDEALMSRILWKCLFEMISQNAQITRILASIRKSREAKQTENIINSRRSISLKYVKFTSENQDRACKIAMDYKKWNHDASWTQRGTSGTPSPTIIQFCFIKMIDEFQKINYLLICENLLPKIKIGHAKLLWINKMKS